MDHFDLPSLRYVPEMAKKYRKIEGRLTVLPAVQSKKVKIIKVAPPLESSFEIEIKKSFFSPNCDFAGLMIATKTFPILPF